MPLTIANFKRTNLPVRQREFPFPEGNTLVSTTDLKGRIRHCNGSFIEVSGFTREELIGQPHKRIRHPDTPEEAFRDLWATVSSGQSWSGAVMNERKNGDHDRLLAVARANAQRLGLEGAVAVRFERH